MFTRSELENIIVQGYPNIAGLIPKLFEALDEYVWRCEPEANLLADFLFSIGKPLVPFMKEALISQKLFDVRHYLFSRFIFEWPFEFISELEEELKTISITNDYWNQYDLDAIKVLVVNSIGNQIELLNSLRNKKKDAKLELLKCVEIEPQIMEEYFKFIDNSSEPVSINDFYHYFYKDFDSTSEEFLQLTSLIARADSYNDYVKYIKHIEHLQVERGIT
ncbi:hypothetical protein PAESOLCIP111_06619 [Paenibacillus solanacearum]|uniref:Uncharacterized protein n=1 Tax=Paenibacillus solanacearum TaxID=2048548 RepID=A0A916KAM8_9BACL|nr:hypothetical protein [Paenibacillus solanacearum]CAG7652755.1 hypothetical protein PAESOLCIP111_06619 [Paenibacillus solanacearum]